jgi:hypothetical protein
MSKGYDPRCLELARLFIEDEPLLQGPQSAERADRLAQAIQDCIEEWIAEEKS